MYGIHRVACAVVAAAIVSLGVIPEAAAATSTQCNAPISTAERSELVQLFDPTTLTDTRDGQRRMDRISTILNGHHDRSGTFAIFYRHILATFNQDMSVYDNPAWAEDLGVRFLRRYMENGYGHFTGGAVSPYWTRYYQLAADCGRSAGRVGLTAVDVHILIDFPSVIADSRTTVSNTRDFYTMGNSLVTATDSISAEMKDTYGADLGDLFHLYLAGTLADSVLGQGTTTYSLFQGVRTDALVDGLMLENPVTAPPTWAQMQFSFAGAEAMLDGLEAAGRV